MQRQLSQMFKYCYVYHSHQPTFLSGHYAFLFASDNIHPMRSPIDWEAWHRSEIPTYYYSPDVHHASFMLPALISSRLTMTASLKDVPQLQS